VGEARRREKSGRKVPQDKVPVLRVTAMALTQMSFDPQEGFVLSRINGEWNARAILKLCPLPEDQALAILARLMEQKVTDRVCAARRWPGAPCWSRGPAPASDARPRWAWPP